MKEGRDGRMAWDGLGVSERKGIGKGFLFSFFSSLAKSITTELIGSWSGLSNLTEGRKDKGTDIFKKSMLYIYSLMVFPFIFLFVLLIQKIL